MMHPVEDKVFLGDCLEIMKQIHDKSIDMILCDLPYGTTSCRWDVIIPFQPLWEQYERIIKDDACIALFGTEPFSSHLRLSNLKMFKYDWIWEKSKGSNFAHAKFQPLKTHEIVSIFSKYPAAQNPKRKMKYFPQMTEGEPYNKGTGHKNIDHLSGGFSKKDTIILKNETGLRYPRSVQYYRTAESEGNFNPTQKPIGLCEYFIKTYTNEGEIVLDNCAGSGTSLIAARNLNRRYIGIEKDKEMYDTIIKRMGN